MLNCAIHLRPKAVSELQRMAPTKRRWGTWKTYIIRSSIALVLEMSDGIKRFRGRIATPPDPFLVTARTQRRVESLVTSVGDKATVLFDSGVRSGTDVLRVLACGAKAALAGRPFLFGVAALGDEGADYVIELLLDEIRTAIRQAGLHAASEAGSLVVRHRGALQF